ncbi:hypothetical protein BaRGS_00033454, partial [Batillaria attramentaria]
MVWRICSVQWHTGEINKDEGYQVGINVTPSAAAGMERFTDCLTTKELFHCRMSIFLCQFESCFTPQCPCTSSLFLACEREQKRKVSISELSVSLKSRTSILSPVSLLSQYKLGFAGLWKRTRSETCTRLRKVDEPPAQQTCVYVYAIGSWSDVAK